MTEPCPNGCNHTDEEHDAFDSGVFAGEQDTDDHQTECPHQDASLREAWLTGYSVGEMNRIT